MFLEIIQKLEMILRLVCAYRIELGYKRHMG
jgi:hypothetical protein